MTKKWSQSGNDFWLKDITTYVDGLPLGVYTLEKSMFGFYLTRIEDSFSFSHKIYGLESGLIDRVKRTWESTNKNLGILLNGLKGTGKTVTAKTICNELKLPVILVNSNPEDGGVPEYLSSIDQDCIVFIDEYEKIYGEDSDLLTIMDGVLSSENRKLFLLTTNKTYVNENLIQRPSRIRYFKTFKDLSPNVIEEIVDDLLVHKQHKTDLIKFISNLEIITIDVVKTVIEEVNIHNEAPEEFKDVFNVKKISGRYTLYEVKEDGNKTIETVYKKNVKISPRPPFNPDHIDSWFYFDGEHFGIITDVIDFDTIILKPRKKGSKPMTIRIESYDSVHVNYKFAPEFVM